MSSTISHFEMNSREEFCSAEIPEGLDLRMESDPGVSERLYREVGADWQWRDRLIWSAEEWGEWIGKGEVMVWRAFFEDREAGYVEMEKQEKGTVEVVYFGLLPTMIGKGLGGGTLSLAVKEAWAMGGVKRVWLHTCTEDHPHAVSNYEKRGFRLFKTEAE